MKLPKLNILKKKSKLNSESKIKSKPKKVTKPKVKNLFNKNKLTLSQLEVQRDQVIEKLFNGTNTKLYKDAHALSSLIKKKEINVTQIDRAIELKFGSFPSQKAAVKEYIALEMLIREKINADKNI